MDMKQIMRVSMMQFQNGVEHVWGSIIIYVKHCFHSTYFSFMKTQAIACLKSNAYSENISPSCEYVYNSVAQLKSDKNPRNVL